MGERAYVSYAEVKEKVALPEVLEVFGVADRFSRRGEKLSGVCPLPDHHHGPQPNGDQFKIDRKDGVWLWHCFGDCGRGGDVVEFVKAMTGYDNHHVRFWFAEHFGDRLNLKKPRETGGADKKRAREDHQQSEPSQAHNNTNSLSSDAPPLKPLRFFLRLDPDAPYLAERGIEPATIARYGIGLCRKGALAGYVAIPVHRWPGVDGENPVGYLGRWPGEDFDEAQGRPRYKAPPGFETSRVVLGLKEALAGGDHGPLIVVEGPFKLFHLVQNGFPNTVSTLSANMTDDQAALLAKTGRTIVLFFDGDDAGYQGARRAAAKLITRTAVRVVRLPEGVQPDHLAEAELRRLIEVA